MSEKLQHYQLSPGGSVTHIVRYITHDAVSDYERLGWRVTWYGWRGDGLACFIASFRCCRPHD